MPAYAVPDQTPLVNRPEGKPLPNLMLTFDESGSMTQGYLPEGKFTVGKFSNITFGIQGARYLFAHPKELTKNRFTGAYNPWPKKTWTDSIFMTSVPWESQNQLDPKDLALQYKSRSPQVNLIYYNPTIKYKPWTGITKAGVVYDFKTPNPKYARLDPLAYDGEEFSEVTNRPEQPFTALKSTDSAYPSGWVDTSSYVDLTTDMQLPDGTVGTSAKWHSLVNRDKNGDPVVMTRPYSPALVYLLTPGLTPDNTGSYVYFNLNRPDGTTYPRYEGRTDCQKVTNVKTGSPETFCDRNIEIQNYTNWFVFYRSRLFIAQGALPDALLPLSNQFRLGWGGLHAGVKRDSSGLPSDNYSPSGSNVVDDIDSPTVHQGVREWTKDQKYALTKWLRVLKTYGGTPTRQATQSVMGYFQRTDPRSPWSSNMEPKTGSVQSPNLRCRRAYNVVLTDGYYNEPDGVTLTTNVDGKYDYPFKDESTKTLADYAMNAWETDLQGDKGTDLTIVEPDRVKPIVVAPASTSADDSLLASIKSDPANYRHLTQFYMGFGLTGNLLTNDVLSSSSAYDRTLLALAKCGKPGGICWKTFNPDPSDPTKIAGDIIDDIWHASINSRGQFFNISNPDSVRASINSIVNRSSSEAFKEGGVATASPYLESGNIKFVPEYTPYTWIGSIKAYDLNNSGKASESTKWIADFPGDDKDPRVMPQPEDRNIYVGNSSSAVSLNASDLGADMIHFLRGENGDGPLRQRDPNHLLPDFINSTPLFVKGGSDLGVADDAYPTFHKAKTERTNGLLFIGGNGGMVHAFNVTTGREVFAYVPNEVHDKINKPTKLDKISSKDYGYPNNYHTYSVDGQLTESDVVFKNDQKVSTWVNMVVGTMGAGGRSIFAFQLDTVDPTSNLNATTVRWDKTSSAVGYITSTPQIAQLPDGSSRIFVGNGVDSPDGAPALLSIDPDKGAIEAIALSIPQGAKSPTGSAHGLGGVTLVKDKKTGYVSTIYAGDTLGQMWRFDVDANGKVSIGYNGNPLFKATDKDEAGAPQPITAAPLVYAHPLGGQVVVFNTGKLLYDADNSDLQTQSAYGIWDKTPTSKSSNSELPPNINRTNLVHQRIKTREVMNQSGKEQATFFDLTSEPIEWTGDKAKLGWVLDLAVPAETSNTADILPKAIYDPQRFLSAVLISAVAPGSKEESCIEAKARGFGFLIDALTGKQSKIAILDTNGDGLVTAGDSAFSGFAYQGGAQRILTKPDDGPGNNTPSGPCGGTPPDVVGSIQNAGGDLSIKTPLEAAECSGYKVKDRIWRQLFNPPHP